MLAFHPLHGTFVSGGCDGVVNVWDGANKKRLSQWTGYPTSIASLSFSPDGQRVAIASSYTYEEGNRPAARDEIYVRDVSARDVVPKSKGSRLFAQAAKRTSGLVSHPVAA